MSSCVIKNHNKAVLASLEPGDLIEFDRVVYQHWGVFIGNGEVVHRSGGNGPMKSEARHISTICGTEYDKGIICKDDFWDVVDYKAYKNNSKDRIYEHFEPAEVVARAISQVGKHGYNLLFKNCEHFASWCRYGREVCDEGGKLVTHLVATGFTALPGADLYCLLKRVRENEKQKAKL